MGSVYLEARTSRGLELIEKEKEERERERGEGGVLKETLNELTTTLLLLLAFGRLPPFIG